MEQRPPSHAASRLLQFLLCLLLVLGPQLLLVENTNFFGYDEWTILALLSRHVTDIPYANRPLELLWALPLPFVAPHSFWGFAILYWAYLWLAGGLVFWIVWRLFPGRPSIAFFAGVFAALWSPSDYARLSLVERALYIGISFGMLLSMAAFVESWRRRSRALLALAALLCLVSGLCYEVTLLVLFLTPLLLFATEDAPGRELFRWTLAFEAFVGLGLAFAARPMLFPAQERYYQMAYGLSARPAALLPRLLSQYELHFGPLLSPPPMAELIAPAVLLAAGALLAAALLFGRIAGADTGREARLGWPLLAAVPLTSAGYGAVLLADGQPGAWRAQFLSAPGAALFLACGVAWLASRFGRQAWSVSLLLAAWIVAVGAARTVAMQRDWNGMSYYAAQHRLLVGMLESVPDVEPRTLLMLLDANGVWRSNFGFHHAVEYLYRERAIGFAWGTGAVMFPAFFTPRGVVSQPWPEVRRAWGAETRLYPYADVVVIRYHGEGKVAIVDEWPSELPPLPPGARYAPRTRVRAASEPIARRRSLWSLETR